jgi:peptide/nickel transport system substrate-binding protein
VVLQGISNQPTGAIVAPQVNGWTEGVHKRHPHDPEASKKLLAQAGYSNGFEVDFACPNNRYINDEEICQAVTAMWARSRREGQAAHVAAGHLFPDDPAL